MTEDKGKLYALLRQIITIKRRKKQTGKEKKSKNEEKQKYYVFLQSSKNVKILNHKRIHIKTGQDFRNYSLKEITKQASMYEVPEISRVSLVYNRFRTAGPPN